MRAPALVGRRWSVTGASPLPLPLRMSGPGAPLRGRVVVLHFFTAGCVNCVHAHAELRTLAGAHPRAVLLGVHSPKFPHEATETGLDAALVRADLGHPVLDDAHHQAWSAYAVGAWPTIVVVDPDGYVARVFVGEGHGEALDALVARLLGEAPGASAEPDALADHGTAMDHGEPAGRGPSRGAGGSATSGTALSSPSAALALPGGRVAVADAGNHRVVVLDAETATSPGAEPLAVVDGLLAPAGMALLPPVVAAEVGWDLAVADPGAHTVLGVRLADASVRRVAGTGAPLRPDAPGSERGGPALGCALSSPAALAWCAGVLVVAMSGVHQLWVIEVAADPADGRLTVVAGSGAEGLLDGRGDAAMLAQPSALATDRSTDHGTGGGIDRGAGDDGGCSGSDGVWCVDAESSSLRRAHPPVGGALGDGGWEVTTVVGTGVHAFGAIDGPAGSALMQHPLGVAVAGDGAVLVADTYNGAVRRVDVAGGPMTTGTAVSTLAHGLAEPVAVVPLATVAGSGDTEEVLLVVESAAHRLSALRPRAGAVCSPVMRTGPDRSCS